MIPQSSEIDCVVEATLASDHDARQTQSSAATMRSLIAVLGLVIFADVALYSNHGYAGVALLLMAAPCLLVAGATSIKLSPSIGVVAVALVLAALRLVWQGNFGLAAIGLMLIAAFAMSLRSLTPYLVDLARFIMVAPYVGVKTLVVSSIHGRATAREASTFQWLSVVLPVLATSIFATIFVYANPDLRSMISGRISLVWDDVYRWLDGFSVGQIIFWLFVSLLATGFMFSNPMPYPVLKESVKRDSSSTSRSTLFAPIRNMLISVTALFAIYLAFEFYTLWYREFPQGFYYAGYAHAGAAWLTVALALSTLVMSFAFQGDVLTDPRIGTLRRWAWVWSCLNLVLAIAVYHRLSIYIDFNGMTRMRTIGLFGVTCVVVGFIWVILKIKRERSFVWLIHRHSWTLAATVFLYLLTPVDVLVHSYNVQRILAGHLAPAVQITEHPLSDEGVLMLAPLLDCEDELIREGIRSLLAIRQDKATDAVEEATSQGWTSFQGSTQTLKNHLDSLDPFWTRLKSDSAAREQRYKEFKAYAFQWY